MLLVLFCKQKTAYELRISDWSSDVCSSDLSPSRYGSSTSDLAPHGKNRSSASRVATSSDDSTMSREPSSQQPSQSNRRKFSSSRRTRGVASLIYAVRNLFLRQC